MFNTIKVNMFRKIIAIVLIISLITVAASQTATEFQTVDSVQNTSFPEEFAAEENVSSDTVHTDNLDASSVRGNSNEFIENRYYRQPAIQNRGIPVTQSNPAQSEDKAVQRKLLPAPVITSDTSATPETDSSWEQTSYKMGKTEKKILLVTGAVLLTGALAIILTKALAKKENPIEKVEFPEPPRTPEY